MRPSTPQDEPAIPQVEPSPVEGIPRPVFVLSVVSFFTDVSSEMVYPLIPLFLTSALGAPLAAVGLIEGVAESTASFLKTGSGWLSDRLAVRKPLVVAGYALSGAAKPLMAAAHVWPAALGVRFLDRSGKGLRTAPRDALIADATPLEYRGRAFGFHRAADTMGAVIGPGIGLGLLALLNDDFRTVFLIAGIPALAGVAVLWVLKERKPEPKAGNQTSETGSRAGVWRELGRPFYVFLGISLLFALGNSSDVFLILRSKDLGLTNTETVSAYVLFNAVYSLLAWPAGAASDRLGRRNVIGAGFALFSVVYFGFAVAGTGALAWPLFAVYGVFMAMTEGVGKALVTDLVPGADRATALGLYTGGIGAMVLAASLLAGGLWDLIGPSAPFALGGVTGLAALAGLVANGGGWARSAQ
ncbi:MAG TPA: MFS transporter [Dehalococcoidia bacterium]|nr:MFS transporter [Dehalococcoidia bacterium]